MNSNRLYTKNNKKNPDLPDKLLHKELSIINLAELECGNPAKVLNLKGSHALIGRLEAMGILPGAIIIKKSAIPAKGPIIVEKGATQFALGYDTAQNILVEPVNQED
jgi:Fe2+ transport system protein FeoA